VLQQPGEAAVGVAVVVVLGGGFGLGGGGAAGPGDRVVLFQRRWAAQNRRICSSTIRNLLTAALASTGLTDADGRPLHFTPHDFRRIFITDAKMGRIASDASFGSSRERALPAAQRAALRRSGRGGAAAAPVTWDVSSELHLMPECSI